MAKYSDIRNSDVYKKAFEKAFQKAVKNNPNRIKEMAQQHTETVRETRDTAGEQQIPYLEDEQEYKPSASSQMDFVIDDSPLWGEAFNPTYEENLAALESMKTPAQVAQEKAEQARQEMNASYRGANQYGSRGATGTGDTRTNDEKRRGVSISEANGTAEAYREAKAEADRLQKEEDEAAAAREEKEAEALRQDPENKEYWAEKWQNENQRISEAKQGGASEEEIAGMEAQRDEYYQKYMELSGQDMVTRSEEEAEQKAAAEQQATQEPVQETQEKSAVEQIEDDLTEVRLRIADLRDAGAVYAPDGYSYSEVFQAALDEEARLEAQLAEQKENDLQQAKDSLSWGMLYELAQPGRKMTAAEEEVVRDALETWNGTVGPDLDVYYETARRLHELGQSTEEVERLLMQTQIMDTLATKLSGVRSAFSGAGNALPLVPQIRESLEDSNWENAGFEGANPLGLSERSESAQTQNPLAYGAGYMGSMLGQYALGSAAMKAIPGAGSALGRAGERLASTGAAQALQRIPVLGQVATQEALTGMLGDTLLDLGLDTAPTVLRLLDEYNRQQREGLAPGEEALTIGDILKEAGINIATNAGFNVAGELAPAAMRALSDLFHGRPVMSAAQSAALDKMAQGLKLTDTEQRMVDNLTEAYPDYVQQREFLPLEAEDPVILDNVLRQEEQGSVNELARAYRAGTLTNAQMETLKPGGVNRAAFEQATGVKLPETSSETRRVLREGLDNGQRVAYSETMSSTGGAQNEFTGAERVRSLGEDALPMGQGMGFADGGGGNPADGDSVLRGFLSPTENINNAVARTGATPLELRDTTSEPQLFSSALEQARQNNPHGLMVSGKSVEELTQPGTVTFMSRDGLAGALVTADGDIEAVFKNPQSGAKGAGSSLLLNAVNNGGTKLDCYGDRLVNLYAKHGFEPVARVPWNPEYAPAGWTYGPQDVFVMKLADGVGIDDITARLGISEADGGFHRWTREELDALPVMDYDAALAYRDELIEIGKTNAELQIPRMQTGAAQNAIPAVMDDEAARPLAELDVNMADWNEINRSPEIQQARRKAMFETPTVATNTPERQALRQEIAEDLMRMGSFSGKDAGGNEIFNGPVKQERRADIVIGPPAAGKSSVLANPLSQKYGSRIIDSDTAKTMLPEFDGGFGAGRVHEESAFIAETLMLRAAVQNGENIVIPWVGKNPQKLRDTLKRLKQNGYSVHLSLNELDPDKAARRAVSRFQNTGRFVDPNYVLSVGWKPSEVYDILKKEGGFDSYVKYSNDVPYGQPARLVEGPGVVEEVQAGRMGRLGGRPGTGNSYRVGYGENATERVSSLDNQAAFSVGEIPYLSEETAETFSEYIPSLMDDASMSVSAPVSGLTRGQATGSALETDIPNGMRERGFAESLRTKSDLPDEVKAEFVDTPEIYRQLSNTETIAKADAAWGNGLEEAQRNFRSLLETRDPAAIPLGKNIADELIRQGKSEDAAQLLRDMSAALTSSGQFSQAAAIALMKEDPMTALSYLQKQIDKMNAEGAKKFGKKWKDFTLTDNEIKAFGDVAKGDEEALKSLYEGVGRRIAKEYPATMKEKVVELSHIAMLLNPRTQVRNVLSNIAMMPATAISDKISAVGQKLYSKANPNFKPELALTASKESKDLAAQVYDRIKGRIDNTASKWENSATQGIREKEMFKGLNGRTAGDIPVLEDVGSRIKGGLNTISQKLTGDSVFDALSSEKSVTENVRQLTYGLLELGDKGFVAQRFKSYLSKAIEASGAKTLDAVPASAIDRAVQEAMKATFKDDNALTRLVSSIKRNTGFIGETLLPFTKTPANVTMRALDYSPAGIASAVKMAKNGTEASAVIDQVAKATTGTLAILLGIGLYNKGIITGPEDEDPDKAAFQKQQGWLPYAVKFGDNYYTYDWAQPGSMGLVLGSTIMSQLDKDGSIEAKDLASIIKNSVSAFGDTLLQQSTLQNLLDVFSGYGSPTENMTNEVLETPQRLIPSLVGATARVADTTQRSTYSKGDFLKTQIDTLKSKIPGLSQTLPATYDTWGNEVQRSGNSLEAAFAQYLNPGQLGYSGGQTPIDEEIMRLYDATNNSGVFPHKADRTVTIAGEEIDLDNQQYSEFQRLLGQASYEAANAFLEMPGYDSLADEQKADALQNAYAAAKDIALSEMFDDYSVPKTRGKYADMYEEFGTDGLALWAYYKQIENWDGEGGVRNEDRKNAIDSLPGLTRAQRSFMWILSNGSETSNPYD